MCVFVGYNDRYHVGYRLYSLTKVDFIITNDATFFLTSALNFSVINKPMSERYVNKIYSELTTTVGALATTGLMMYIYQSAPTLVMMGLTLLSDIVMISLWLLLTFSEL